MGAPAPPSVTLAIHGPIAPDDLPGLRDRVCALMAESGADVLLCDVLGVEPDAGTVDALPAAVPGRAQASLHCSAAPCF